MDSKTETVKFKGYRKNDKYYWYTVEMLQDKRDKKLHQLELLQEKIKKISAEINQIENALLQRQSPDTIK